MFLQYASFSLSEKSSILIPSISIKVNVYPSFVCKQLLRISFTFIISFAVIISTAFSSVCSLFFFLLIVRNRYTPPARASATIKIISCLHLSSLFYRIVTMSHRTLLSHRTLQSHRSHRTLCFILYKKAVPVGTALYFRYQKKKITAIAGFLSS